MQKDVVQPGEGEITFKATRKKRPKKGQGQPAGYEKDYADGRQMGIAMYLRSGRGGGRTWVLVVGKIQKKE